MSRQPRCIMDEAVAEADYCLPCQKHLVEASKAEIPSPLKTSIYSDENIDMDEMDLEVAYGAAHFNRDKNMIKVSNGNDNSVCLSCECILSLRF